MAALNQLSLLDSLVLMKRENLNDLPQLDLAQDYQLKVFQPEDEKAWEQVYTEAFEKVMENAFDIKMRRDPDYFDPNSIFMIWKIDKPVATASAWVRNIFGSEVGYLHKVAVISSERGKGLGYQATLACLHKMLEDGRSSSVLRTQVKRIAAIKIYLKLGYKPWITEEDQLASWKEISKQLEISGLLL